MMIIHTSTPKRIATFKFPEQISLRIGSTSGTTILNFVFGTTATACWMLISLTVLPRPFGYCSVTISGRPRTRVDWTYFARIFKYNKFIKRVKRKENLPIYSRLQLQLRNEALLAGTSLVNHKGKRPTYPVELHLVQYFLLETFYSQYELVLIILEKNCNKEKVSQKLYFDTSFFVC